MNISNYLKEKLLLATLNNTSYVSPSNVFLALFPNTVSPSDLREGVLTEEITEYSHTERAEILMSLPSEDTEGIFSSNTEEISILDMPETALKYAAIMNDSQFNSGDILYWSQISDIDYLPVEKGQELLITPDSFIVRY